MVMSLCSALIVLLTGFVIDSTPYSVGGEMSAPQWIDRIARVLGSHRDGIPDSVLLVNVAYDKILMDYDAAVTKNADVPVRLPVGKIDVTDRRKLADFLEAASGSDYRYMMLDIRFDDDIRTDSDALRLFDLIGDMPRLVFARHEGSDMSADAPASKSAYSDYHATMTETNMVKYPLIKHGELSIAARMYEDLGIGRFSSFLGLVTDGGSLVRRSIFLTYPVFVSDWAEADESVPGCLGYKFNYLNLGMDLLSHPDSVAWIQDRVSGKIVVVGDFVNDMHECYVGSIAGPLINLNAFINLTEGRHRVKPLMSLMLLCLYFVMSYVLLSRRNLLDHIPLLRRYRSTLLRVIISFVGFSAMLNITAVVLYLQAGIIYSVVYPSLYFTFFNLWIQKRNTSSVSV